MFYKIPLHFARNITPNDVIDISADAIVRIPVRQ